MTPSEYLLLLAGATLPSLLVAWAVGFLVRRFAPVWGLIDHPSAGATAESTEGNGHKAHQQATPLGGGLAIVLAVIAPFAVGQLLLMRINSGAGFLGWDVPQFVAVHAAGLASQSGKLWTLLAAGVILMLIGLVDDARGLPWPLRLGAQLLVAGVVVWMWDWGLTAFVPWRLASQGLAVLWIVALVNAFNMLDNMDGLSAGVAAICAAALATILIIAPDPSTGQPQLFVAGFLLVLIGALVGFLAHNSPPAKLFMGDAGSYFIGFCLAIATMQATYTDFHGGRSHALLAPLCLMAVPLYDMGSVVLIRLWNRQSIFHADRRHFSHRLADAGFSKTAAVGIIYLITAATGIAALFLHRVNFTGAILVFAVVIASLAMLAILERIAAATRSSRSDNM